MSGDTVIGKTIQFTNDNKYFYGYTGSQAATGTYTTFMEFQTQSEYLIAKVQPIYFSSYTSNIVWDILFNDLKVQSMEVTSARDYTPFDEIHLIIPPFTNVKIKVDNLSGGTEQAGVSITGKVGMAQRVGNLDD